MMTEVWRAWGLGSEEVDILFVTGALNEKNNYGAIECLRIDELQDAPGAFGETVEIMQIAASCYKESNKNNKLRHIALLGPTDIPLIQAADFVKKVCPASSAVFDKCIVSWRSSGQIKDTELFEHRWKPLRFVNEGVSFSLPPDTVTMTGTGWILSVAVSSPRVSLKWHNVM